MLFNVLIPKTKKKSKKHYLNIFLIKIVFFLKHLNLHHNINHISYYSLQENTNHQRDFFEK
jgi:hypothetical protein